MKIEIVEWPYWLERIYKQKDYQLTMIGHVEAWDIGIYANPNYYFQYDSQEFRDAYANALKYMLVSSEISPRLEPAIQLLGYYYLDVGDTTAAVQHYLDWLEKRPNA